MLSEYDDPVQVYLRYLSQPKKKTSSQPPTPHPSKAVEAVRVSRESDLPLTISTSKNGTDASTKKRYTTVVVAGLMDAPPLDLNQLVNRKR